jgi:hypothetical protein
MRPPAPGPDDLAPWFRAARRHPSSVEFEFDAAASEILDAFVAAERVCCPGLQWDVARDDGALRLRVSGTPEQAEALAALWA